jgi:glycosyltransferase involved in cell wall biosynthesis
MKKIKVFALPSHQTKDRTSGVDFARIIQPMKHLDGYTDEDVEFEVDVYDIAKEVNWLDVAKKYDIIYFNYLNSPWGFAAMGAMARKFKRKIVMDLDDNLWGIREDNPAHEVYQKGGDEIRDFTAICNEVDYITVTNSYLKNVVINNTYKKHDKVIVFPNYVDLKLYSHRSKFKDTEQIQLVHYGSTTHFEDLSKRGVYDGCWENSLRVSKRQYSLYWRIHPEIQTALGQTL